LFFFSQAEYIRKHERHHRAARRLYEELETMEPFVLT
jgi:hypothetical protein